MMRFFLSIFLLSTFATVALAATEIDDPALQLPSVRRVFVEPLTGDRSASQIRDMIISALQSSKLFVLTENAERADAIMKGSAEDLIYTDTFQSSEGITARGTIGSGSSSSGRTPGTSFGVGENENTKIAERKHEATAAVRLVNRDGDVLWSTTQESQGAKFRSASADVADKVARQLIADIERIRKSK